jgi:hypothetical protein
MVGASNEGANMGAYSLGIPVKKIWLSALKETTREDHADLNNTAIGMDELFQVGDDLMEYPGDPSGSPGNVINCLCAIAHESEVDYISQLLGE